MTIFQNYRLHHVGIIFPSLDDAARHMETFGLVEDYRGFVEPWNSWCIFTKCDSGTAIELVVATDGPLTRFNRGLGGVHHFAYQIEDFDEVENWCAQQGLDFVEPAPIKGAGDFLCNFIHPLGTRGVQIELVQPF